MRTHILSFILIVLLSSTLYGQSDTLTKVVDYSIFPIGAIRWPLADSLEKMLGMNCNWMGFPPPSAEVSFPIQERFMNYTGSSVKDPFYYDVNDSLVTTDHQFILASAAYAIDVRVFLPNTSGKTEEYLHTWETKIGFNPESPNQFNWLIRGDTVSEYGGYVLKGLSTKEGNYFLPLTDPYTAVGIHQEEISNGNKYLNKDHIGTYSYDLVFFFDQLDTAGVGLNDSLYSIEYWVKKQSDTGFIKIDSVLITKNLYKGLSLAVTQVGNRKVGAEKLDIWDGQLTKQYKLHKKILNIRDYFEGSDLELPPQVDVRVKTYKRIPIYVRMLRIRDWVAQRLLTGTADNTLNTVIDHLKSHSINSSIKSWTIGNEPPPKCFHGFGYVNDLLVKKSAPCLNVLAPYHYDLFARVVRDQSENIKGKAKPILLNEWTIFTGNPWRSYGVHQHLTPHQPYWYWNHLNYQTYPPTPLPGAFTNDSANLSKRAVFVVNDYDTYTRFWQDSILGWCAENSDSGRGQYQEQMQRARSCYELDPANPVPYHLMPQTLVKRISAPKWEIDSLKLWKADSLHYIESVDWSTANDEALDWAKDYYHSYIENYLSRTTGDNLVEDSLFHLFYEDRNPTVAEMDYQLWSGILHGIKSYIVNVGYSDGLDQQGFLKDTLVIEDGDTTHRFALKSHQRNDFDITQAYLTNPYDEGDVFGFERQYRRSYPLLPGYKELFNDLRSLITTQLGPIATKLSKLLWQGTVSWHKRDQVPTYLSKLAVKSVSSKSLTGSLDSANKTYVHFGIHTDPADTIGRYVSIQNRRLWCNVDNTDTTDYRKVFFKVDTSKFAEEYKDIALWQITDVATAKDTILHKDSLYSLTLKPGQGRLIRIAPAIGLQLGRITSNSYNNGRHVAAIESPTGDVERYLVTYERDGHVIVSYPVETPVGLAKRTTDTPVDSLFDTASNCYNPAIAYNIPRQKIGLTYWQIGRNPSPTAPDTMKIWYRTSAKATPYAFSAPTLVDFFLAEKGYKPPPAIAPKIVNDSNEFWVTYNRPDNGGNLVLMDNLRAVAQRVFFWGKFQPHVLFTSVSTHAPSDTCHIAFEEEVNNGLRNQIHYVKGFLQTGTLTTGEKRNLTSDFRYCENHFPQIAAVDENMVFVTWEAIGAHCQTIECKQKSYNHFAVFRERIAFKQWLSFNLVNVNSESLPSEDTYEHRIYPNIVSSGNAIGYNPLDPEVWQDFIRQSWSSPKTPTIGIFRQQQSAHPFLQYKQHTFTEPSAKPAMPTLSKGLNAVHPFSYEYFPESGSPQARIIRYDFPHNNIVNEPLTWHKITANDTISTECAQTMNIVMGDVLVSAVTGDPRPIALAGANDTINGPRFTPIVWQDKRVRSDTFHLKSGDTLSYQRFFSVGDYEAGDTTEISNQLADSSDYLNGRIYLRRILNHSVVAILDSCRLTKTGFTSTTSFPADIVKTYISGIDDSVYLTLELRRGVDTNGFQISHSQVWGGGFFDAIPFPTLPGHKIASESNPQPASSSPVDMKIVPNPFDKSTHISVDVPKDAYFTVMVFDVLGKRTMDFFNGISTKTHYDFTLDGNSILPGTYFVRIQVGNNVETRKIEFIK